MSIEDRDDELQRRISKAEKTDPLMRGLVKTVQRTRLIAIIAVMGFVLDIVLTVILAIVSVNALKYDQEQRVIVNNACNQSIANSLAFNTFLRTLMVNAANSTSFSAEEKKMRIESYKSLLLKIVKC